jgi:integrase
LGLDRHEAAALMGAAEAAGTRDLALVSLLMLNGLRVSEAIELRIEDLTTERGHRIIRVKGKGGKQRTTPLPPPVVAAIEATISKRTGGPIILSNQGTAMDRFQASRVIRRLARRARIQKKISPHSLRHTFVTLALEAGAPIHVVQDAAGHASPETTRRYDRARFALDGHAAYTLSQHLATAS